MREGDGGALNSCARDGASREMKEWVGAMMEQY